jgi:hypothetical protein
MNRARLRSRPDAGMVTAELAAALTALVLVLVVALNAVVAGIDLIRCTDAARVAARAAARGDDPAAVRALVRQAAPDGATSSITGDQRVHVAVRAPIRGPLAALVRGDLTASAVAVREQSDAPS